MTLNYATAYYGLECEPAIFETAVRALAEGNSIWATGRILQIDKDTLCDWLDRAALHCRSVALYFWTGITDHVWKTSELLSYRIPVQFLDQMPKVKPLFALPDEVNQGN